MRDDQNEKRNVLGSFLVIVFFVFIFFVRTLFFFFFFFLVSLFLRGDGRDDNVKMEWCEGSMMVWK